MAVKYVKDFEFSNSGKTHVRGYMRGGSCGYEKGGAVPSGKTSEGKTAGKGPEHTLGFAKGGAAKAPKGLSVMIAVGTKKAPPAAKKGASPVPAVPLGLKKGGAAKVEKVMGEYGKGELHSGSKEGPVVKNPKQAVAIALSEARKAGAKIPVKKADGGLMRGMGAMSDAEARRMAAKAALAKAPTRAQFDAMMAKRAAADAARNKPASMMTPAERAQISGGEGVNPMTGARFGRPFKKGGSSKC